MLKVAVPNKGALSEDAVTILRESGYNCRRHSRELITSDAKHDIEFIFLRPRDIAIYVGNGTLDLGITGRDLAQDSLSPVEELLALNFGKARFCLAGPADAGTAPPFVKGLRIATSYANIVRTYLDRIGASAQVIRLDGAVEIAIQLGVADLIADVVQSGQTLREAGLHIISEPLMHSEAIVIARAGANASERAEVARLLSRLQGTLVARQYAMVEYDCPRDVLGDACQITPGIESPTVAPLNRDGWVAVKSMVRIEEVQPIMEALSNIGAKGIIVCDIRTCRL